MVIIALLIMAVGLKIMYSGDNGIKDNDDLSDADNEWTDSRVVGWMDEWMDGWMDVYMYGWMMDGWMDGWMDG